MTTTSCIRESEIERRASFRHDASQRPKKLFPEIVERCQLRISFDVQDHIDTNGIEAQLALRAAEDLADPAANLVSVVTLPELTGDSNAKARVGEFVRAREHHYVPEESLLSTLVDRNEIAPAEEALTLCESFTHASAGTCERSRKERALNGEALTAFAAAAGEHSLTFPSPHADQETVSTLSTTIVRLKRSF